MTAVEDDDKSLLAVDNGSISLLVSILGEVMGVVTSPKSEMA
jgi:hypothetical protein